VEKLFTKMMGCRVRPGNDESAQATPFLERPCPVMTILNLFASWLFEI
jgi:hypothetical protein